MIVTVSTTDTVLSVCHCLSALIGCPSDDLHVFHRGMSLVNSVGLLWEDIPWLRCFPYLEICVRSQRPQIVEELCLAELEQERKRAYGRMNRSIYFPFCHDRFVPLSGKEIRYLEICSVVCRIDLRKGLSFALHNVVVCYMREVIQVHDLPRSWIQREVQRVLNWIQHRRTRLHRKNKATLSLRG